MRIKYHEPIPNFFKQINPTKPKDIISNDLLEVLYEKINEKNFAGISYSKLDVDFKNKWGIEWDNIIILKYFMSCDILKLESSKKKVILEDMEFQNYAFEIYEIIDFLRSNGFKADYIHPLDDKVSLRSIALKSNDCVITRNNMCLFKEGLNIGFFMISTSINNLPFKNNNDMLWVKDYCLTCGICIDRCPENAFDRDEKVLRKVCTAHKEGCSNCINICPFFKQGYDKVKKRYDKKCLKK